MQEKSRKQSAATYGVMILCLLAAAIGAWGAARKDAQIDKLAPQSTASAPSNLPTEYAPADVPVTGVPYSEPETETETETEAPQPKYLLPMGSFIVKDYSGDSVVYSNTMQDWRVHTGVDFGDSRGQSVLAIADGTVTDVREDVLWGVVLTVDHGDGVIARYCGLEKGSTPEVDTEVEQGVVIGKLGEIPVESKDGPHLHLEIRKNGVRVDPWKLLQS